MGRPAKITGTKTGKIGKQETAERAEVEDRLRGDDENICPAYELTDSQRKIFDFIRQQLQDASVLGVLDVYVLTVTAVSIDRVSNIDVMLNQDATLIMRKEYYTARGKYMADFWRGCNELCLSPQARAKIGIAAAAAAAKKEDPLAKMLGGDDDGD